MKTYFQVITIMIIILLIPLSIQADLLEVIEKDGVMYAGEGWMTNQEGIKLVYFSGTPEEIGQQHGLFILNDNPEMEEEFADMMKSQMNTGNFFVNKFRELYAKYQIIPNFKRHIPEEYLEELKGMIKAVSGGQSKNIDELIMANAMQDLGIAMGCSIVSTWGDSTENGDLLVGRNLDHLGFYEMAQSQYLAFYNPSLGYKFVSLNYPVNVGLMQGMNEQGLVIAMTYSFVEADEMTINGMPYTIMLRHVLQYAADIEEAVEIIKETPRTVGLNIMLASAKDKRAVVVESSANRLYVRENDNYIYATNRFRSKYMQEFQMGGWIHSELRDIRFEELINVNFSNINYQDIIEIMRDKFAQYSAAGRGFVGGIENAGTMASLVFRPEKLQLYVSNLSMMPAPESEYIAFDCAEIWQGVKPVAIEVINEVEATPYNKSWLKVSQAELASYQNDEERVQQLLKPVVKEYPQAETPLLILGISYIKSTQVEKGIDLLERFTELPEIAFPDNEIKAYFWLAVSYDIVLDQGEKALEYYRKVLEVPVKDISGESGRLKNLARQGLETGLTTDKNGAFVPAK